MADLYCDYIHNTAQSLPITKHLQHNKNIKDTIFIKKKIILFTAIITLETVPDMTARC